MWRLTSPLALLSIITLSNLSRARALSLFTAEFNPFNRALSVCFLILCPFRPPLFYLSFNNFGSDLWGLPSLGFRTQPKVSGSLPPQSGSSLSGSQSKP
jgi:hypothetical protein